MDEQQYRTISTLLERIAVSLETIARGGGPVEPNFVRPLAEYPAFDWDSIGASIVQRDADGPTHIEHNGAIYTRRSPSNKFGAAIWYSRANGRDDDGNVQYLRLITFKPLGDAEGLPRNVEKEIKERARMEPQRPAVPAQPEKPAQRAENTVTAGPDGKLNIPKPGGAPAARPGGKQPKAVASLADLIVEATTARYNLSPDAASAIAKLVKNDWQTAAGYLPYFAECKASKLPFKDAKQILVDCGMDMDKAAIAVRQQVDQS